MITEWQRMKTREVRSFVEIDIGKIQIPCIGVYNRPSDYPDKCVARLFDGTKPTNIIIIRNTVALDGKYVNFERFLDHAVELDEKYRIEQIGFDQWGSTTIINRLEDRWDVIPIGQGTKTMTQVINDFENLLVDERLIIAENECFRFMAKNCIAVYDEMLGVKYSKRTNDDLQGCSYCRCGTVRYFRRCTEYC